MASPAPTAAPADLTWVGILAGLAGSIAINLGNNLQSLGMHNLEMAMIEKLGRDGDAFSERPPIEPSASRTWRVGTCVFVIGSLLNFGSYGFAAQSLLASLEAVQFVTNVAFGRLALGKPISRAMYAGTGLTVAGTVLTCFFSSKQAAEICSIRDLLALWANPLWLAYLVFALGFGGALRAAYQYFAAKQPQTARTTTLCAVLYATFSALFGTLSVVCAKLLAELLALQTDGVNVFSSWFLYAVAVAWVSLVGVWLWRMNAALALYEPLLIIPLLQANFIFFAIVSGGIHFREFDYMRTRNWAGFGAGVFVIFGGLSLLAPGGGAGPDSEEPAEEDGGGPRASSPRASAPRLSDAKRSSIATEVFMSATSRMFLEHSQAVARRARAEKELELLLSAKALSGDDAARAKQLMVGIRRSVEETAALQLGVRDLERELDLGISQRARDAFESECSQRFEQDEGEKAADAPPLETADVEPSLHMETHAPVEAADSAAETADPAPLDAARVAEAPAPAPPAACETPAPARDREDGDI